MLLRRRNNVELYDLYCSPNIIRVIKSTRMRWASHVARMENRRDAYKVLVGRPEGERSLGIPRLKWEDNIRTDRQEVGLGEWAVLIWNRIGTGSRLL
jgi:hypothetical protein